MPLVLDRDTNDVVLAQAVKSVRRGGIVAFPTETVYGLGADIRSATGIARLRRLKGVPIGKPLLVHCHDPGQLSTLVDSLPELARTLIDKFWPGPLALVFTASASVPEAVSAGTHRVGIRLVDNAEFARFAVKLRAPLVGTSANYPGTVSPRTVEDIDARLLSGTGVVIDAGSCHVGVASTVVDVSSDVPRLLRAGALPAERIERALGLRF